MSIELFNRNKANVDADLLAAREEAKEEIRKLSDDELGMVTGGADDTEGDGRVGMDEAMADINGLMSELDGWD